MATKKKTEPLSKHDEARAGFEAAKGKTYARRITGGGTRYARGSFVRDVLPDGTERYGRTAPVTPDILADEVRKVKDEDGNDLPDVVIASPWMEA